MRKSFTEKNHKCTHLRHDTYTLVAYLNDDWKEEEGGALKLYIDENDNEGISVMPQMGTFVVFLSERFPHEVLPTTRERHSVAGWFRVNGSVNDQIDPPK